MNDLRGGLPLCRYAEKTVPEGGKRHARRADRLGRKLCLQAVEAFHAEQQQLVRIHLDAAVGRLQRFVLDLLGKSFLLDAVGVK